MEMEVKRKRPYLCAVSIAFGVKHFVCGFSFTSNYDKNPIECNVLDWGKGGRHKSSSCILFRPDQTFHSFGYEAEDKYEELTADNEHNKWYFFEHPTKMLYDCKDVNRTATIFDETNKPLLAIKVFTSAINYLKDKVIKKFKDCSKTFTIEEIKWVFPVSDIWDGAAKQLFREAVIQSGIPDEQLALCLETEAVSTLFRYLTNNDMSVTCTSDMKKYILQPGSKYLILSTGEEFSYVTVLEVLYSGNLRELHKTSGCPWGNATVNQAFIEFMKSLVGAEVLKEFREKNKVKYADMITRFEVKNRSRKWKYNATCNLSIPYGIKELYKEQQHNTLDTVVKGSRFSEKVSIGGHILRINPEIVKSFFSDTCDSIIKHIKRVLNETNAKDISTILMVGELSESPIFQDAVKQAFSDKRVFASYDPGLDVLGGSVIFGHDNNSIITTNVTKNTCRGPRKV